ncbi:hypothetical protein BKI52_28785 [marine bacterium AO1-C]|nr:hypothetical protein BKI52_28785 [marine bacterium AO1-C]
MIIEAPYTYPKRYIEELVAKYGMKYEKKWSGTQLSLLANLGTGQSLIFLYNDFCFYRTKWAFHQKTLFQSTEKVGENNLVDFRIDSNRQIFSSYAISKSLYEWETTNEDSFHLLVPSSFIEVDSTILAQKIDKYYLDPRITSLLEEIFNIPLDSQEVMLLEPKLMEFVYYLIKFINDNNLSELLSGLNNYEVSQLKQAKEILDADFTTPPTIEKLSKMIGLNTSKLKSGFRSLHKITIRQYIIKKRMTKAKELITTTNHPITYICELVGYTNRGHFASLYKKFFGNLPLEDRSNNPEVS